MSIIGTFQSLGLIAECPQHRTDVLAAVANSADIVALTRVIDAAARQGEPAWDERRIVHRFMEREQRL